MPRYNLDRHGLTPQERSFADALLTDPKRSKGKAYATAYSSKNSNTARVGGAQVFARPQVKTYIRLKTEQISREIEVTHECVVQAMAESAFSDPAELFDTDGKLIPIDKLPRYVTSAIQSYDIEQTIDEKGSVITRAKVKFVDKRASRYDLARALNMFEKDNNSKDSGLAEILAAINGTSRGLPDPAEMAGLSNH